MREGLNHDERIARLEGAVFGDGRRPGLDAEHDDLVDHVRDLTDRANERTWWGRLIAKLVRKNGSTPPAR